MKIVIYGIGTGRLQIEQNLKKDCEIVAYTDGYSDIETFNFRPFVKREKLLDIDFEYLVLATREKHNKEIIRNLVDEYQVEKTKIIDYYGWMASLQHVDQVMSPDEMPYEGMILGISHARYGINPRYLSKRFCNLALDSQDLYYNKETFRYCIRQYGDQLDLRYVILDMFDYNYFNFDTSRTTSCGPYILGRGIKDEHHLEQNKNYSVEEKEQIRDMVAGYKEKFERLLSLVQLSAGGGYPGPTGKMIHTMSKNDAEQYPPLERTGLWDSRFEDTILENLTNFEEFLSLAYSYNPDMRVILLQIPRSIWHEELLKHHNLKWKEEFENVIRSFQRKYPFEYYDLKQLDFIRLDHRYYFDIEHLNYTGGAVFTSYLEQLLFSK